MTTWSRRGFLGLVGSGTALASLASLRAIPAGAAVAAPGAAPFFGPPAPKCAPSFFPSSIWQIADAGVQSPS